MHTLITTTVDESGGLHMGVHVDETSLTGVGADGKDYHASGEDHSQENTSGPPPVTTTVMDNFRIIGPEQNDNFFLYMHTHVTVNANGVPTAQVDNNRMECR